MFFFFSIRRRHTISYGDWSSDVCSSDLCPSRDRMTGHGSHDDNLSVGRTKVAYLAPAFSVHVSRWLTSMRARGYDVELITMHRPQGDSGLPPAVRVHQLPFPAPVGYYLNRWHLRALLRLMRPP